MLGVIKTAIICMTVIACLWIVINGTDKKQGDE